MSYATNFIQVTSSLIVSLWSLPMQFISKSMLLWSRQATHSQEGLKQYTIDYFKVFVNDLNNVVSYQQFYLALWCLRFLKECPKCLHTREKIVNLRQYYFPKCKPRRKIIRALNLAAGCLPYFFFCVHKFYAQSLHCVHCNHHSSLLSYMWIPCVGKHL